MFNKDTTFKVIDFSLLESNQLIKLAGEDILPEPYDPEFLYIRVRAVSAGEYWGPNKNADYFSEEELKSSYNTFLEAHVFKNHENKHAEKAIGGVLEAKWDDKMKYVELLIKIDRTLAPEIVRGFEKGYTTDVSMGCRVQKTICSICSNEAKTRAEFCSHIKTMRNQILPDGRRVFEYNIGPKFHDISVVLNGADRTAKITEKVANSKVGLEKVAGTEILTPFTEGQELSAVYKPLKLEEALGKKASISKLAELKKEIIDKLYTLAILNRFSKTLTPDVQDVVEEVMKEAAKDLDLSLVKEASISASTRNLLLGTLGMAGLTNYYQGKRLRGEQVNSIENFIADNPGVLPAAYFIGSRPAYRYISKSIGKAVRFPDKVVTGVKKGVVDAGEKVRKVKDAIVKSASYSDRLFSKEASSYLETREGSTRDIFSDKEVANLFKSNYDYSDSQVKMVKAALLSYAQSREDLVDEIKTRYAISDDAIGCFVQTALEVIDSDLEKEASVVRGMVESQLFFNKPGMFAAALPGALIDGLIFNKLFHSKPKSKAYKVADTKSEIK